jgi:hypothetical protein
MPRGAGDVVDGGGRRVCDVLAALRTALCFDI